IRCGPSSNSPQATPCPLSPSFLTCRRTWPRARGARGAPRSCPARNFPRSFRPSWHGPNWLHEKLVKKTNQRLILAILLLLAAAGTLPSQEKPAATPSDSLANALAAACREQPAEFSRFLPEESAAAYLDLPQFQQQELMRRLVAVRDAGKPLRSTSLEGPP